MNKRLQVAHHSPAVRRSRLRLKAIAAVIAIVLLNLAGQPARAVSPNIVISQVYGGGGNSGATYTHDFVELFNRGITSVSLAGWSIQYASATGSGNFGASGSQLTELPAVSLAPGQYLLIQEGQGSGGTTPLPSPDFIDTSPIGMAATSGKVALVNSTSSLGCNGGSVPCSSAVQALMIDLVGFGSANFFEGAGPAPASTNTTSLFRLDNGCLDTDNNATDFVPGAALPRNTASPLAPCDGPTNPSGSGAANPSLVAANNSTLLTVAVTPGTSPTSTGLAVSVDLSAIGGSPAQSFVDDGSNGDVASGDNIFSHLATVAEATSPGAKTVAATISDAESRTGNASILLTIASPPVLIRDIQGVAHRSSLVDQNVTTQGIVTVVTGQGFYLQDPNPDSDDATAEAIFVYTNSTPPVLVGDSVLVAGTVTEFRPGGSDSTSLTTTEITAPAISVLSSENPLPPPIIIGSGGRVPPNTIIEDDASGSVETSGTFDPANDGIDFYESLEAMRVQVNQPVAVGPTNAFGEIPVVGDQGAFAGLRTPRGGVVIQPSDFNPERIILDDLFVGTPNVKVGANLDTVVGVLDYSFGNFKLLPTAPVAVLANELAPETAPASTPYQLAVATFNVENLDPKDPQSKFDHLATLIVDNLQAPDLIAVEEIQDNNGPTRDAVVDADQTFTRLIDAIQAAGGPVYHFRQINPVDDQDGGEPGGNIRVGFLFRTDRGLSFVDRPGGDSTSAVSATLGDSGVELSFSPGRVAPTDPAFDNSRKPVAGEFTFHGDKLFVIANHFNSKGGDEPLFGHLQPPTRSSEIQRHQQAQLVNTLVDNILAVDANANVIVVGDLNDFEFSQTLDLVKGGVLVNLLETLPQGERYTYVFDGNSQALDHTLVSEMITDRPFSYDIVHVNAEFPVSTRASDHDLQVAFLCIDATPPLLEVSATPLVLWPANHKYMTVNTTVAASDNADPQPVWTLVSVTSNEADSGLDDEDVPNDIEIVDSQTFNLRAERSGGQAGRLYTITYQATDACGNSTEAQATVTVPASQKQAKAADITLDGSESPAAEELIHQQYLPQLQH